MLTCGGGGGIGEGSGPTAAAKAVQIKEALGESCEVRLPLAGAGRELCARV